MSYEGRLLDEFLLAELATIATRILDIVPTKMGLESDLVFEDALAPIAGKLIIAAGKVQWLHLFVLESLLEG